MQFGIILTWVGCSFAFHGFPAEVNVGITLLEDVNGEKQYVLKEIVLA